MIERIVATRSGDVPQVIRIHSSAIAPAPSPGFQASRPNAYQLACAKSWPVQLASCPVLATPAMPVSRFPSSDPSTPAKPRSSGVGVGVEELLPHRRQVHEVVGLAEVLLRDLQLRHQRRLRHRAEQRMERLARLEVERAVLDLDEDVRAELSVERDELRVGALDAIGIDVRVVDEGAPHDDAAVGRERVGEDVGAVRMGAAVVLRPGLPFAVRLDDEAAEVGDER